MRHRIYSRIRHVPTGAWTDILITGRTKEEDVIPVHPQNVIDSHLEAAAKVYSLPITEFEVVEMLDADPAGAIFMEDDGTVTHSPGGQPISMLQPKQPTPLPPPPSAEEKLAFLEQEIRGAVDAPDLLRRLKARMQ